MSLDIVAVYPAVQMNRQTISLFAKYPFYSWTFRTIAINHSFGPRALAHSPTKRLSYFRNSLRPINQPPNISKPQSTVWFLRYILWDRNPIGNAADQNSLGMLFEDTLL